VARRTKEAAAITREQLLDAAENVFREHGVAGSSLGEVAAAAGVTRGALYWHFRDKADLYAAMCERATLPLETMLDHAGAATHADPIAALRELALTALLRLAGDPRSQAVFEVMFHGTGGSAELAPVTERKQRERRHCFVRVERVLAQAVHMGQLPPDTDVALATQALHAYIAGIMHEWVLDPQAFDLGRAAPALIDAMLAGLCAAPPRLAARPRQRQRGAAATEKGAVGKA
jgi:TetR/AcrR family acrAB operon transcriptional repressor